MTEPTEFPDWLAGRSSTTPDRIALIAEGRSWTFAELDTDVTRLAQRLWTLGVRARDRIATLLHNGSMAAILPHAALRLGAAIVPLNVRLTEPEIAWQIGDMAPRLLVVDNRTLSVAERAGRDLLILNVDSSDTPNTDSGVRESVDDDADLQSVHDGQAVLAIIYTSGTTGRPKGVMLTVSNFWWSAIGSAVNLGTYADDRWLACLPLFHVGGLSIVIRSAIYGTTAVVHDGFDPDAVNAAIDDDHVTIVSVVAVMLQRMLDARGDRPYPPSLRCILLGGGPAPTRLLERCLTLGVPVVQTYGLTECCSQVATLAPDDTAQKPQSSGRALFPNELRIAAADSELGLTDDAGEIQVRGPIVMAGYAGLPDVTSRTIVDGWLHTGDIGRIDGEGYLYVLDRRDDLIITGGENVYPAEVEAVLSSHPAIAEVGVIGIADPEWGQTVVAVARLAGTAATETLDAATLQAWCRAQLAGYKVPAEFHFVAEALPRTPSGKIRRSALRGRLGR